MFQREFLFRALALGLTAALAACGTPTGSPSAAGSGAATSSASGGSSGGSTSSSSGGTTTVASCEQLFAQRVQPRLDFCRSCHVPGGVADVPDGKLYQLSSDKTQDYAKLRASWEALGRNDSGKSRILKMASGTDTRSHTGGTPWPVGSDAYKEMDAQLLGFVDAAACNLGAAGGPLPEQLPLLGSMHGGHAWFNFCEGKPDTASLPPDPRSLVQPGVNHGKAVYYNFYWKDCHVNPELVHERPHPKTCGELRQTLARGSLLMKGNGVPGQASVFAGTEPNGYATMPASDYNNLWQTWGLSARPDNFDELVAERYGSGAVAERNPYPVPTAGGALEDPNRTDGGSGQLPRGWLQTRNADGSWSGIIGNNCQFCHSTTIDGHSVYGAGGSLLDTGALAHDSERFGNPVGVALDRGGLAGRTRGTNNAQFSNIAAAGGIQSGDQALGVLTNGSTASGDTPAWWNVGHRPMKFVDAPFSGDAVRVDLALFFPILDKRPIPSSQADADAWLSAHGQDADAYIMSLKSPEYPLPVDQALAEQGAILFHSKNLWAANLNNPAPKPEGGNGSCASCHGAYSPRYVNDSAYLDTPALEGIASYVVPAAIIGTDAVHMNTYNEGTNQAYSNTVFGYPQTKGADAGNPDTNPVQDCGDQNEDRLRGTRAHGYAAPPLYGVWATAPYFHNGSVPNVWEVLKPADRQPIWRRVSKPARADQAAKAGVIMGYDTDTQRAYDPGKLGWQYDALACGTGTRPYLECDPADPLAPAPGQLLLSQLYANVLLGWNITNPPTLSDQDIENRKIYNTRMFSQGNAGHDFTAVLTDQERRALIEYLKTL